MSMKSKEKGMTLATRNIQWERRKTTETGKIGPYAGR